MGDCCACPSHGAFPQAHGVESVPLVAPIDVVGSRLALSCFARCKLDASSGDGVIYAAFVPWFAEVSSESIMTTDKPFSVMMLFMKTVQHFHPLPATDGCSDPNTSMDNRALRILQRVHYTQLIPLFTNGMRYLSSIACEEFGPIGRESEADEGISFATFRAWLVWLVTLGPSGGIEPYTVMNVPESVGNPVDAVPKPLPAPSTQPTTPAPSAHAVSPLYPTVCDDKCCKHCNRKSGVGTHMTALSLFPPLSFYAALELLCSREESTVDQTGSAQARRQSQHRTS